MKKIAALIVLALTVLAVSSQSLQDLSYGESGTFEVATWNLEGFPKDGKKTVDSVATVIRSIGIDLYGLQEIDSKSYFDDLVDQLTGYDGHYESGGLSYIYNSQEVELTDIYEIYTSNSREFPRSPLVMELTTRNEDFVIINNHLKCCGDGTLDEGDSWDEENRRLDANDLLKDYIEANFDNKRVIVLGDYNDVLSDNNSNNVFQNFINDSDNFLFADTDIADGSSSGWSFPNWPSHIDHIMITNELFDEFNNQNSSIEVVKIDKNMDGGFSEYDDVISDHRPVAIKIQTDAAYNSTENLINSSFKIYPNPARGVVNFSFMGAFNPIQINITDIQGRVIEDIKINTGQKNFQWNNVNHIEGTYFIKVLESSETSSVQKVVLK